VYGLVAGLLGVTALVLLVVALFRLHVYLPFHPEGRRVWISYAGMGAIFVALGGFLWRKRTAQPRE
jgi:protein-S-isoprenylcysteine O-methyltransferase Ste14